MTAHSASLALAALVLSGVAAPAAAEDRRFMVTGFDRVRVDGPFEVVVRAGTTPGAVAVGDRRAVESVNVRVQGTTLVVSGSLNGWGGYPGERRARARIEVTAPPLRAAAVIGGGQLSIDRMAGQRIELTLTGAGALSVAEAQGDRIDGTLIGTGRIAVAGRALTGRFQANGVGNIEAERMSVADLTVTWQSAGDGRFAARNTARVSAIGAGSVSVYGSPSCTVRGNGPVACGTGRDRDR
jgi:hypothetical protein